MLAELQRQRETILHTQATLGGAGGDLKSAEGALKKMARWFNFG